MRRKKILLVLLTLALVLTSVMGFVACKPKKYVPEKQGSKVMTIDKQDINGQITNVYNKFNEFNGSPYANMKIDNFDFTANKSFYTRAFFRKKRLIVTAFNDLSNVRYYIDKIDVVDGAYNVHLVRMVDTTELKPSIKSYACFLEVPTREKLNKDTKVNLHVSSHNMLISKAGTSIATTGNPLEVARINSSEEMDAYREKVDDKTREVLTRFDEAFFTNYFILTVDYIAFERHDITASYDESSRTISLYVYNSDHYATETMRDNRFVRYVKVPRGKLINNVELIKHWETDFDEKDMTTTDKVDFKNYSA